jgi:DNA-binding MarR family transcriptional regulator
MTRIVTGLEREGLVKRKGDPHDRRLTQIEATSKGQKVLTAGRARRVKKLATAVSRMEKKELAELRRGVQLLRDVVASMRG